MGQVGPSHAGGSSPPQQLRLCESSLWFAPLLHGWFVSFPTSGKVVAFGGGGAPVDPLRSHPVMELPGVLSACTVTSRAWCVCAQFLWAVDVCVAQRETQ